jgi:hypothetical protein
MKKINNLIVFKYLGSDFDYRLYDINNFRKNIFSTFGEMYIKTRIIYKNIISKT